MAHLADLFDMARDRSQTGRRALADKVGDFYFSEHDLTDRERDIVVDILRQVLRDAEMDVRRALSERLASHPGAPRDLIVMLANDQVEIAGPILLRSEVLEDEDLIAVVQAHAEAHQLLIASRSRVNPPVCDALIETGNMRVAETLLGNLNASLSGKAMIRLTSVARRVPPLRQPLLGRPELTPELATRIYWLVSQELRRTILDRFKISKTQLDAALQATVQDLIDGTRGRTSLTADQLETVERMAEAGAITPQLLIQTLRLGQIDLFKALFGRIAGLSPESMHQLIAETGGEALTLACRALRIDKGFFASIFLLSRAARPGEQIVDPRELSRVLALYDRVTPESALPILQGWRQNATGIHLMPQRRRERPDA
ncbi:hypothetical protein N825_02635 [Skermanella stibiiresistens SB22]|uniref:DUF2336 domain-containing protein n=2 Tax=Skermanella TaxID=204447 RepID=W9HA80_9PROT|nr:hypothetical protein N825_02635 [Skermanella stibiiresistens SB22]